MAIANNNLDSINNMRLSIQISLNGLSFCILNTENNTITFLKHIKTDKPETPFKILDILIESFETIVELKESFHDVHIIYENELSTLVPLELFKEENLADYLKFNSKILKSDFISYDTIHANNSVNVYVPYVNINNFIYEKFGTFTYRHFSTILIETLLKIEKGSSETVMYVNVNASHFEIVALKRGELLYYNSFEYNTKEDFIYYILFAAEQLQLNPETLKLKFLGAISKEDSLYGITYKYIRHVTFGSQLNTFNFQHKSLSDYSDFTLIQSF